MLKYNRILPQSSVQVSDVLHNCYVMIECCQHKLFPYNFVANLTKEACLSLTEWIMWMQLKNVLMAVYFGADHVVWAGQAGIVSNKDFLSRSATHLNNNARIKLKHIPRPSEIFCIA